MKNLIKVPAVSLVAITLLISSVGSAMAGSNGRYSGEIPHHDLVDTGSVGQHKNWIHYTRHNWAPCKSKRGIDCG